MTGWERCVAEQEKIRAGAYAPVCWLSALGDADWEAEKSFHMEDRTPQPEAVNHPSHYGGDVPHEVVKCLEAWGLENDALLWNTVKYIARSGKKGPRIEDLRKASWYLNRRIESLEGALNGTTKEATTR